MLEERWADKFLPIRIFIDFLSKISKVLTIEISMILCRLSEMSDHPKIIPTSKIKKISKRRPRFSVRIESGSKK